MANYVHDENHNRVPAYSAEEFLSLLAQVIESGDLDDVTAENAFITKLKSIINGNTYSFAVCTQSEYNALVQAEELQPNTIYIISDDSTISDIQEAIAQLQASTSANILQLQTDVGGLKTFVLKIGIPQTIVYDDTVIGDHYVSGITTAGVYEVTVSFPSADFSLTYMLSIDNLNTTKKFYYPSYPNNDGTVSEIRFEYDQGEIWIIKDTSGYLEIESCHLIAPYRSAQ